MSQIALPLTQRSSADPARIIVGNAIAQPYEALKDPAAWPYGTAVLTGPPRSGKSLLGRWAQDQGITVLDDADRHDETKLFHRWNAAQEKGETLLLIASRQDWQISLPDLRSRLGAAMQLEIGEPDDAMAQSLIEAIALQRGLALAEGAAEYLVPRTERSFAAIEGLVVAIDRLSLERKVPATMSIWRAALEQVHGPDQQRLL
ncbi:MAG: DnaA/Hda family protein [Erythrobacter sp.]